MSVNVEKNSMLRLFTLREIDGIEFWAEDTLPVFEKDDSDNIVKYTEYDLIDVLAAKNYMDEVIWWGVSLLNQFWNSLRALEKFSVRWVDSSGFSNEIVIYGEEFASQMVDVLVGKGISSSDIVKERIFDAVRIASSRRMFGLLK